MGAGSDDERRWAELLRDPLIRLVMRSDGVSEAAMIAVCVPPTVTLGNLISPPLRPRLARATT